MHIFLLHFGLAYGGDLRGHLFSIIMHSAVFLIGHRDIRLLILEHGRWSMTDKYETLMKGLSIDSLLLFVKAFKSQLFAEGLVQGNFTSTVSTDLSASSASLNDPLF